MATEYEIVRRRFGRDHEQPCNDPNVTTCARWACQAAGCCQRVSPKQLERIADKARKAGWKSE